MTHFRAFFEALPWWTLRSDEGLLCGLAAVSRRVACGRSSDGRLAVVYATQGPLELDLAALADAPVCPRWFDPSAGTFRDVDGAPWGPGSDARRADAGHPQRRGRSRLAPAYSGM